MTVEDLIDRLKEMPQDYDVIYREVDYYTKYEKNFLEFNVCNISINNEDKTVLLE